MKIVYKSNDGKIFNDQEECYLYEETIKNDSKVKIYNFIKNKYHDGPSSPFYSRLEGKVQLDFEDLAKIFIDDFETLKNIIESSITQKESSAWVGCRYEG